MRKSLLRQFVSNYSHHPRAGISDSLSNYPVVS
jgi:hypothetical protein